MHRRHWQKREGRRGRMIEGTNKRERERRRKKKEKKRMKEKREKQRRKREGKRRGNVTKVPKSAERWRHPYWKKSSVFSAVLLFSVESTFDTFQPSLDHVDIETGCKK